MFDLIKSPKGKLDEVKGWSIFINTICQLFHICHLSTSPPKLMLLGSLLNIWLWNFRLFLFDDPHLLFSFRLCSRRQTWVSSISLFVDLLSIAGHQNSINFYNFLRFHTILRNLLTFLVIISALSANFYFFETINLFLCLVLNFISWLWTVTLPFEGYYCWLQVWRVAGPMNFV